ncbi:MULTISPECIES: sugar 3,4-ketoisomerase [Hymenobacter]|uniref:WxcM-like, C-terminal n=1 Tax=Hymenobacter mucosus TaxID=1411120 RepID=A0A238YGP2_9BACT|nr:MULTISPECIES: FdtA/QdtA family cupin domain-containing protein [Hymenobacter]SNR69794.1 WxcM-like, C-terminal [Hymenobacter mucosus]
MPPDPALKPHLITFPTTGESGTGYIAVAEAGASIPFTTQRSYWTYFTPESIVRGRHAHYRTEQVLVAVAGRIVVLTEMPNQELQTFVLEKPNVGVYIPPYCWHTMQYSHNAVQLVLASTLYEEADYIREYAEFKRL